MLSVMEETNWREMTYELVAEPRLKVGFLEPSEAPSPYKALLEQ